MAPTIAPFRRSINTVVTAERAAKSTTEVPSVDARSFSRRAPKYWPISTVVPVVTPSTMLVTMLMTWLPVETADTAAVSAKRPTTKRSTAP